MYLEKSRRVQQESVEYWASSQVFNEMGFARLYLKISSCMLRNLVG